MFAAQLLPLLTHGRYWSWEDDVTRTRARPHPTFIIFISNLCCSMLPDMIAFRSLICYLLIALCQKYSWSCGSVHQRVASVTCVTWVFDVWQVCFVNHLCFLFMTSMCCVWQVWYRFWFMPLHTPLRLLQRCSRSSTLRMSLGVPDALFFLRK